jgi:hypothetical protein
LLVHIVAPRIVGVRFLGYLIRPHGETVIMNPRLAAMAALGREVAIPALVLAWIAVSGSAGGAAPIVERPAPSLIAVAKFADKLPSISLATTDAAAPGRSVTEFADKLAPITLASADAVAPGRPVTETVAAEATPASHEPDPIVTAALTDSSEMLPSETSPEQVAKSPAIREPGDASPAVDSSEVVDECLVIETCVDRYLWQLYQRTPKQDAVKTEVQRKVTVRKKGRLVTLTRTSTTVADQNFAWKDPKAAEKAGMSMVDYVIGGVDGDFKLKLFQMLHAAEAAGLSPGITSAFRDDYRQSIASGLKAADDRSYHGGSFRGGYGHGLAADIVSVNGATRAQRLTSTEILWKWVDAHGQEFGIGRPYLDRDPPHVAPIDGKEYADHRPGTKARRVGSAAKPRDRLTLHGDRSSAKPARTARTS